MSTSTGKPFNPSNPSQRDAEHGGAGRRGGEDPQSARSPYAPKRVRGGFIAPVRADDQIPSPPSFLLDTKGSGRGLTDFSDTSLRFGDGAFDEGEWPADQYDHRSSGQRHQAMPGDDRHAAEMRSADHRQAASDDEEELRRLEESVRMLQAASKATHSPEQAEPAAPAGDTTMQQRRRGESLINGYRVPPSLQPQILSAPPGLGNGSNGWLRAVLAVSAAVVIAAPIAYYFSSGGSSDESASDTQLTPVPVATTSVPSRPVQPPGTWGRTGGSAEETTSPVTVVPKKVVTRLGEPPASPPPTAREPAPVGEPFPPVARIAPAPPPARIDPPQVARSEPQPPPTRTLAPAEIELLVKQGQEFAAAGDFVTARVVFQRAAEAGNAVAALAMGASYDPAVLASLGARGVEPDVSKARSWYQRAKDLGLAEASRRLDLLANR